MAEEQQAADGREVPAPSDPADLFLLGNVYYQGIRVAVDKAKAAALYGLAADKGHPEAALRLGIMQMSGDGIPADPAAAAFRFGQAAQADNADASYFLAVLYARGQGVAQNDAEAVRLCILAANAGCHGAQVELGKWYRDGLHLLPRDPDQALGWIRKAADDEYADALYELGAMYAFGEGVERDLKTGRFLLKFAAGKGDEDAKAALLALAQGAKQRPD